ncbi:MAG: tetratricopeptide repeat protein, partial [Planctomycetaceae bacterium]
MAAEQGDGNGRRKIILAIGAALLLLIWLTTRGQPHSRLSFSLPENVRDRDWQRFHRDSIQRYGETAEADGVAILQLAVQLHGQDQTEAALRCLMQIPLELERLGVDAALQRGRLLYAENRVRDAEEAIRTAMSVCPSENKAARDLATRMLSVILAIELRFEERKSLLAEAAERNELPPALLTQYCFGPLIPWKTAAQAKRIKELLERDSGDPALWIAHARHLQSTGQAVAAVQVLKQIREQLPNSKPALAALLEVYHGQADVAAMIELLNQADEFS